METFRLMQQNQLNFVARCQEFKIENMDQLYSRRPDLRRDGQRDFRPAQMQQYKVTGTVNGHQQDMTSQVSYSTSPTGVVTVSSGGLAVTTGTSGGVVTVTATSGTVSFMRLSERRNVLLPQPLGPMSARTWLAWTSIVTSFMAILLP